MWAASSVLRMIDTPRPIMCMNERRAFTTTTSTNLTTVHSGMSNGHHARSLDFS
jgi:hypothetical protein